jgi:hypothetical protein
MLQLKATNLLRVQLRVPNLIMLDLLLYRKQSQRLQWQTQLTALKVILNIG